MKKYVKKGVAFIGMRHLFLRNATPIQRNATPFLKKKHYICTMKEILETMPRIELALIIIGDGGTHVRYHLRICHVT